MKWPSRQVDSLGSAQRAQQRWSRRPGSLDWLTAPGKSLRQAESQRSAPARPKREEAARQARLQTKPAASCDRTRHRRDPLHARPNRFTMHIKVTNLSPRAKSRHWRWLVAHYDACAPKAKAAPRGGLWEGGNAFLAFTRCRVRAGCSETAESRRPQGRIHRAP
jgi:hypothetical protein